MRPAWMVYSLPMEGMAHRSSFLERTLQVRGYGAVLLTILLLIVFQMAGPDGDWGHVAIVCLQTLTILSVLRISGMPGRRRRRFEVVVVALAALSTLGFVLTDGDIGQIPALSLALGLAVVTPVVILAGLVRDFRAERPITVETMFAVLCVYLLVGVLFATVYSLINEAGTDPFFAQGDHATISDFLYFSFVTMTTTGFGDLTAAQDLGRSMVITQALIGQIYLVTVVALIVSRLGRRA